MSAIQNALTPEEWAANEAVRELPDGNFLKVVIVPGEPQPGGVRHATAALSLRGASFGFAQSDVDALRAAAEDDDAAYRAAPVLRSLADRIAALLPPT